jgi:homoserine kinase
VFNVGHASLLVLGLERGDLGLVSRGLADRVHQPRRAHLYPRSWALVQRARSLGALGATISGAGPTVLVWCAREGSGTVAERVREAAAGWAEVRRVPFAAAGAEVSAV